MRQGRARMIVFAAGMLFCVALAGTVFAGSVAAQDAGPTEVQLTTESSDKIDMSLLKSNLATVNSPGEYEATRTLSDDAGRQSMTTRTGTVADADKPLVDSELFSLRTLGALGVAIAVALLIVVAVRWADG